MSHVSISGTMVGVDGLTLALLGSILATSLISGVIGMAGGMILMGIMSFLLPVETAMILHGVTQLAANGARAILFRRHLRLGVLLPYFAGALLCLALFFGVSYVPNEGVLSLFLGLLPYLGLIAPKDVKLDVTRRPTAVVCGFFVTVAQLLAGVSGPLLDLFFLDARLDRHEVIGTKAITQAFGHLFKLAYYCRFVAAAGELEVPWWMFAAAIACSFAGTSAGKLLVARMTDETFRRASQRVLLALGAVYIWRGLSLLLESGS
jgi:uncharacterized membrane protein YfcA